MRGGKEKNKVLRRELGWGGNLREGVKGSGD